MAGRVASAEAHYRRYETDFARLEAALKADFAIPAEVTAATIKRRLVMELAEDAQSLAQPPVPLWKNVAKALWVAGCCLGSLLYPARGTTGPCDVLVDLSHPSALGVLAPVLDLLAGRKVRFLTRSAAGIPLCPEQLALRPLRHRYDWATAARILTSLLRRLPSLMAQNGRADLLRLYVILLRKIGLYSTDAHGVTAACLISADHTCWSWLRHHLYQRAGLGEVFLIQNGHGATEKGDTYVAVDHFFAFGEEMKNTTAGLKCPDFRPVGSFALHREKQKLGQPTKDFAIAFLEGVAVFDTASWRSATYEVVLDNLARFKEEFPHLRVILAVKTVSRLELSPPERIVIDARDAKLRTAGIERSDELGLNSYEALARARLAITYTSAMGLEALGLDCPFLFCNYDGFTYLPPADDLGFLGEPAYAAFRAHVLKLLEDSPTVDAYFAGMRRRFLWQADNPPAEVARLMGEIIDGGKRE